MLLVRLLGMSIIQSITAHEIESLPIYKLARRDTCVCANGLNGFTSSGSSSSPIVAVVNANGFHGPNTGDVVQVNSEVVAAIASQQPGASIQAAIIFGPDNYGYIYTYNYINVEVSIDIAFGIEVSTTSTQVLSATFTTSASPTGVAIAGQPTAGSSTSDSANAAAVGTPLSSSSTVLSSITLSGTQSRNSTTTLVSGISLSTLATSGTPSTTSTSNAVLQQFNVVAQVGQPTRKRESPPITLTLNVTVDRNKPCPGSPGAFQIVSATGTYNANGRILSANLDTGSDSAADPAPNNCFVPNPPPQYFDSAGIVLKLSDGRTVIQRTDSSGPVLLVGSPGNYEPFADSVIAKASTATTTQGTSSSTISNSMTVGSTTPTLSTTPVSAGSSLSTMQITSANGPAKRSDSSSSTGRLEKPRNGSLFKATKAATSIR